MAKNDDEEITLTTETELLLRGFSGIGEDRGCMLCKWIIEDFETHEKLTSYPFMFDKSGMFPVDAKLKHIALIKKSGPNGKH